MLSFIGEYAVAIDAKGRFLLPSGFRKQLPEDAPQRFVINRGFENCLVLYPMNEWKGTSDQVNRLNQYNRKSRDFMRNFYRGATELTLDNANRLLLPKSLLSYAGIRKDMILSAQGNKIELWDKDTYYAYIRQHAAGFSDLAAEVAGGGFVNPFESM